MYPIYISYENEEPYQNDVTNSKLPTYDEYIENPEAYPTYNAEYDRIHNETKCILPEEQPPAYESSPKSKEHLNVV